MNTLRHLYLDTENAELIETEGRMVINREWGWGKWGDAGQRTLPVIR